MVIGTDCTGSCKSNYHAITTTTAPNNNQSLILLYILFFINSIVAVVTTWKSCKETDSIKFTEEFHHNLEEMREMIDTAQSTQAKLWYVYNIPPQKNERQNVILMYQL